MYKCKHAATVDKIFIKVSILHTFTLVIIKIPKKITMAPMEKIKQFFKE